MVRFLLPALQMNTILGKTNRRQILDARRHEFFPEADGTLAICCMSYILIQSPEGWPPTSETEECTRFYDAKPFLDYTSTYWGIHAAACFNAAVSLKTVEFCQYREVVDMWARFLQFRYAQILSK